MGIVKDPFLSLVEHGLANNPSHIMQAIIADAKVVLASEPRPNMMYPHDYAEENFFNEYYERCALRLRCRLPSFVETDDEAFTLIHELVKMIQFLIKHTPADYFYPGDLEIYEEQIKMKIMEAKLKGHY